MHQAGVKEALERLVSHYSLTSGSLRVFARFENGKVRSVKVATFRVPATTVDRVAMQPAPREIDRELLEDLAGYLRLDKGMTEFVAEYTAHIGGPRLHWFDFSRVEL